MDSQCFYIVCNLCISLPFLGNQIVLCLKNKNLEEFLGKQAKETSLEFDSNSYFAYSTVHLLPAIFMGKGISTWGSLCMTDCLGHQGSYSWAL